MKRWYIGSLVFSVAALTALYVWTRSNANPLKYPVQGIDVSHHQGPIDWAALGQADIRFAYIKATEGGDWIDPRFTENWLGAKNADIARGAYHYFSVCRPGRLQAKNYLTVTGNDPDVLPAALDLEFGGFCGGPQSRETLLKETTEWINIVEAATGKPVLIYTTRDFHTKYLMGEFKDNPVWLRSIGRPPRYPSRRNWTIWQWHHRATLPGISGPVDRNAFHGSEAALEKYRASNRRN